MRKIDRLFYIQKYISERKPVLGTLRRISQVEVTVAWSG